ncbi:GTPase [Metamycoplasma hominis]|uniref:GTPase n=1 Tax=Metamycoplasma hominis TaxID=2098 RepID=UPI001E5FD5C0|nr:GTPase [Metamycoplasma hominis]
MLGVPNVGKSTLINLLVVLKLQKWVQWWSNKIRTMNKLQKLFTFGYTGTFNAKTKRWRNRRQTSCS